MTDPNVSATVTGCGHDFRYVIDGIDYVNSPLGSVEDPDGVVEYLRFMSHAVVTFGLTVAGFYLVVILWVLWSMMFLSGYFAERDTDDHDSPDDA